MKFHQSSESVAHTKLIFYFFFLSEHNNRLQFLDALKFFFKTSEQKKKILHIS